ncbi:hypothetical protein [Clavibacter lycopersici]|uniref:hypothetical protein n=1 Tax=Clavibacter lycopersici TaxID=2301718 RepID=UPI001F213217|nr:hypothetical protein [Clavibacter lycopersici]
MTRARIPARLWFGAQALGGAAWWIAVPSIPAARVATLGALDLPRFEMRHATA